MRRTDFSKLARPTMVARRDGIVLPIVLIFLVIMMLLGITAIRNVTLEEKMSANSRSQTMAFQAAEQALRSCELRLQNAQLAGVTILPAGPIVGGANAGRHHWEVEGNWTNNAVSFVVPQSATEAAATNDLGRNLVADRPRCMVEALNKIVSTVNVTDQKEQFRITARGVGVRANTVVILQSYLVLI